MKEYWNIGRKTLACREGRRIAVLAVDPTALPEPILPTIPSFQ